jgi:hypothetical protein
MSIDDPLLTPPPPPLIRRYRIDVGDGTWWELAWRPILTSFEALHLTRDGLGVEQALAWHGMGAGEIVSLDHLRRRVEQPIPDEIANALAADARRHYPGFEAVQDAAAAPVEPYEGWLTEGPQRRSPHIDFGTRWLDPTAPDRHHRVSWVPNTGELYVTDLAQTRVRVLAVIPTRPQVEEALRGWAAVGASPDPQLSWVERRIGIWLDHEGDNEVPPPTAGVGAEAPPTPATNDLAREAEPIRHAERQDELRHSAQSPDAQVAVEPRWSLPAAPVGDALRGLLVEPAFSTTDVEEFAVGFSLDPHLTEQLVTGRITEVDVNQIAQLCHGLHCSPYDLWSPDLARSILHAFGPERWPRHIEPLHEGRHPGTSTPFLDRRLDALASEKAEALALVAQARTVEQPAGDQRPEAQLEVTCYRRTAVLALACDGAITTVTDPAAPPDDAVEYHFSFRQMTEPVGITVPVSPSEFATGPLPGFDTIPALRDAADQLRAHPAMTHAELIRFTDPASGADQWLGCDPDAGQWQTWDDPRRYYPGNPADVLDPGVFDSGIEIVAPTDRNELGEAVADTDDAGAPAEIGPESDTDWDPDPTSPEEYDRALDAYHSWLAGDRPHDELAYGPTIDL